MRNRNAKLVRRFPGRIINSGEVNELRIEKVVRDTS